MKRNILSLLLVMVLSLLLVGCETSTKKQVTISPTETVTNTGGSTTSSTTKSATQVSSVSSDAVFEGFEWSSDFLSCNAVFTENNETVKMSVEVITVITKNPSCFEEGSLKVTVVYGEHTEEKTVTINKTAHQPGSPVRENVVTKDNGDVEYDLVVYCLVCNEELSRTHKVEKAGSENIDTPWIEG